MIIYYFYKSSVIPSINDKIAEQVFRIKFWDDFNKSITKICGKNIARLYEKQLYVYIILRTKTRPAAAGLVLMFLRILATLLLLYFNQNLATSPLPYSLRSANNSGYMLKTESACEESETYLKSSVYVRIDGETDAVKKQKLKELFDRVLQIRQEL